MSELLAVKQDFTDNYNNPTPTKYLQKIMLDLRGLERRDVGSKYAETNLLPIFRKWAADLGKPLKFVDFLSAYGSDTLIYTNNFQKEDFEQCWGSESTCFVLSKPRQFPVTTWAADISANAISYGIRAGIFDEGSVLNLNNLSDADQRMLRERCNNANLITMNSLTYLKDGVFEQIVQWFGEGKEPGMLLLGFTYPYDGLYRLKEWKTLLLTKFDFYNSVPCFNRVLSPSESQHYGREFGTWAFSFYEYWYLTRRI